MNNWNENLWDLPMITELAQWIAQAKSEILKWFLGQSKLEKKWNKIFLQWTEVEVRMLSKLWKKSDWTIYETYEIYLEELNEPIHTLWIIIWFEDKKISVTPIFDQEAKEYSKDMVIIKQS